METNKDHGIITPKHKLMFCSNVLQKQEWD